ncbi:hypothetical protein [Fusibacter sp. 3D3]|uniref:hypothetical protein n=1 Tax=Fusibacter sp. 3D3 TaxID=1048380 RepID=UPI00085323E0|nr:hypothetical protein [Fusibacter sp. 3D3]GAU75978.1 hypothetical protein F3D3_0574 [Fusibacter sp. 3D3]
MSLWTIQHYKAYEKLIQTGILKANDWYEIIVNEDQMGYVNQEFCLIKSPYVKGSISSQSVNMRENATTSSDIII